jgi:hypothetical protein
MSPNSDWSFIVLALGGADDERERQLLTDALSAEFPGRQSSGGDLERPASPMFLEPRARANAPLGLGLTESIIGIIIFLTGCVAKRLLDDVYELKMRAQVRKLLGERSKPSAPSSGYKHGFVLTLWHDSSARGVVVAAIGSSHAGLLESEALVSVVHLHAEQALPSIPAALPIALYVIVDGALHRPQFLASLAEAHELVAALPKDPRALAALEADSAVDSSLP